MFKNIFSPPKTNFLANERRFSTAQLLEIDRLLPPTSPVRARNKSYYYLGDRSVNPPSNPPQSHLFVVDASSLSNSPKNPESLARRHSSDDLPLLANACAKEADFVEGNSRPCRNEQLLRFRTSSVFPIITSSFAAAIVFLQNILVFCSAFKISVLFFGCRND